MRKGDLWREEREETMNVPSTPEPTASGPSAYAPKWMRNATNDRGNSPFRPRVRAMEEPVDDTPPMPTGGLSNEELGSMRQLRMRQTLDPDMVPDPPPISGALSHWGTVVRFLLTSVVAAGAAFVVVIYLDGSGSTPASDIPRTSPSLLSRLIGTTSTTPQATASMARLVVANGQASVNYTIQMGIALQGNVSRAASVVISGFPSGTALSAGEPLGTSAWRVPVVDLVNTSVRPPRDYVGSMDLTVELRLPDDALADRRSLRLTWIGAGGGPTLASAQSSPVNAPTRIGSAPQQPAPVAPVAMASPTDSLSATAAVRQLDRDEIATLMTRAEDFMAKSDMAAARLLLQRAAEAGEARAALALGATFDPTALQAMGVVGVAPDVAKARIWYERAAEYGSAEASRRLGALGTAH